MEKSTILKDIDNLQSEIEILIKNDKCYIDYKD